MNPLPSPPTSLIGKCLRRCGPKQRGKILEGYAAEVVIACRILGPVAAGKSLGEELFGEQGGVTATPILKVVAMVESGEIPVTREQLLALVEQDESAMRHYVLKPWIIDPTGQSAPPAKKGRKPRIDVAPEPTQSPKKEKPAPKAKPVAPQRPVDPVVESAEPTTEDIPEEEIESTGDKPKRTTVKLPPEYKPEDYLPKPSPPLAIPICGLPATGAD